MAKKYVPLRDRLPKDEPIERELPGGEVVAFRSPLKYEDGTLFEVMGKLENLKASQITEVVNAMALDPAAFNKAIEDDDAMVDADVIGLLTQMGEEFGERMGTVGESRG